MRVATGTSGYWLNAGAGGGWGLVYVRVVQLKTTPAAAAGTKRLVSEGTGMLGRCRE